jgi:peptide/nickel transport system permease protein
MSADPMADAPLLRAAREFAGSKLAMLGALVLAAFVALALIGHLIAPQNPYDLKALDIMDAQLPPGSLSAAGTPFLLGTDTMGRDLFSAILYGLRISLAVGLLSTMAGLALGTTLGLLAGWSGGWVDALIMRIADLQLALPAILVALILISLAGPGLGNVILALILVQWAVYARTVRSVVLVERRKDYVTAAIGLGLPVRRVVFRHVLPNCLPPLIVLGTVSVGGAITLEATLSFLGIGLPATQPSLGLLIANGFGYLMSGAYWISLFPGFVLLAIIMSINLVGDRLRDVLNPKLHR